MSPEHEALRIALLKRPDRIAKCKTSVEVLETLDDSLRHQSKLRVLCAARFPAKSGDWERVEPGKTLFRHKSAGTKWWREYLSLARILHDPLVMLARVSLAPFTWSEGQKVLDLVGADRWMLELCLKHGMRDGFICVIGGRWMVSFWSPQSLNDRLSAATRAALYMVASCAAMRLEELLGSGAAGISAAPRLTPRELAVLRSASLGLRISDTARSLGLGAETVRTHMKKAQQKLGTHTMTHSVAEAMRWRLFP
jgi:LuxR family quorum sensing-dependent transcriptional regulator